MRIVIVINVSQEVHWVFFHDRWLFNRCALQVRIAVYVWVFAVSPITFSAIKITGFYQNVFRKISVTAQLSQIPNYYIHINVNTVVIFSKLKKKISKSLLSLSNTSKFFMFSFSKKVQTNIQILTLYSQTLIMILRQGLTFVSQLRW